MSFSFDWSSFDDTFYTRAKDLLTAALNKSNKPPILVDDIVVHDLQLGQLSPELEILEIGDLAEDRFRGIFKLNYAGDASLTLATKIQANPLNVYATSQSAPKFTLPSFAGATSSLAMPLNVTLSDIRLSGIIIMVFSKAHGLTLVFRNDPLESIKVSSTFDPLPGIARFLQMQIETQIRLLFREELPTILHKLSQRWTPSGSVMASMQGHQSKLRGEAPEKKIVQSKPVSLVEINPEGPEFSPSNMFKLNMLLASQRTLSLFTPSIPEVINRANLETYERFKRQMEQRVIQASYGQNMAQVFRNRPTSVKVHPKRRVVKLNLRKAAAKTDSQEVDSEEVDSPVASSASSVPFASSTSEVSSVPTELSEAATTPTEQLPSKSEQLNPVKELAEPATPVNITDSSSAPDPATPSASASTARAEVTRPEFKSMPPLVSVSKPEAEQIETVEDKDTDEDIKAEPASKENSRGWQSAQLPPTKKSPFFDFFSSNSAFSSKEDLPPPYVA